MWSTLSSMATPYTIIRSTTVDASPDSVRAQITDFRRWVDWSPWEGLDPDLQRTYSGPAQGLGATYAWSGNRKAGAGRMEITGVAPDRIDVDLRFLKPFRSSSTVRFALTGAGDQTRVQWQLRSPRTVVSRVMGVVWNMDRAIGADLEKGLAQLKDRVESAPERPQP